MTEHTLPLRISSEARDVIRHYLQKKLGGDGDGCYFFRRFSKLNRQGQQPTSIARYFGPTECELLASTDSLKNFSEDAIKKSFEIKYRWFSGFADYRQLRTEHPVLSGKEIYLHSSNYAQLDIPFDYTFKLRQADSHITPQSEDLLFLFVSNDNLQSIAKNTNQHIKPRADLWCIVSEQFMRAWTLVQYDWHDSFDTFIPVNTPISHKESVLRDRMFVGNKLMTNSWLKHKLALESCGKKMSIDESKEKYFHLRTEYASRKWVDVYTAMVLVSRYGELPCPCNVPNNKSSDKQLNIKRNVWSLPDVYVTMLLHKCCPGLIITDHLINYNAWKDYSKSSMMFSIHGQTCRGFFDDIHQINSFDAGFSAPKQTSTPEKRSPRDNKTTVSSCTEGSILPESGSTTHSETFEISATIENHMIFVPIGDECDVVTSGVADSWPTL